MLGSVVTRVVIFVDLTGPLQVKDFFPHGSSSTPRGDWFPSKSLGTALAGAYRTRTTYHTPSQRPN